MEFGGQAGAGRTSGRADVLVAQHISCDSGSSTTPARARGASTTALAAPDATARDADDDSATTPPACACLGFFAEYPPPLDARRPAKDTGDSEGGGRWDRSLVTTAARESWSRTSARASGSTATHARTHTHVHTLSYR